MVLPSELKTADQLFDLVVDAEQAGGEALQHFVVVRRQQQGDANLMCNAGHGWGYLCFVVSC